MGDGIRRAIFCLCLGKEIKAEDTFYISLIADVEGLSLHLREKLYEAELDASFTIQCVREAGIEVYFEKENIWTLDSKGELLITIMSSLAQEESRSISEKIGRAHV